jgi:DNA repair exonuclease SbcCD ATPase subunit
LRILRIQVTNFGSYPELDFTFDGTGLALIYGPTGSGKSTVLDAVMWTLYGETIRGGSVDEVRSWVSAEPVHGSASVVLGDSTISIFRVRGQSNDLYWTENGGEPIRGKNLTETQSLLAKRLGCDSDLYRTGSYVGEYSSTAHFFTSKAKERRSLFEKIAPLDLPVRLGEAASAARKAAKRYLDADSTSKATLEGRASSCERSLEDAKSRLDSWETAQCATLDSLALRHENFEAEKASKVAALQTKSDRWEETKAETIADISASMIKLDIPPSVCAEFNHEIEELKNTRCSACGGVSDSTLKRLESVQKKRDEAIRKAAKYSELSDKLLAADAQENPFTGQIAAAASTDSPYAMQHAAERKKINPFLAQVEKLVKDTESLNIDLQKSKESCQSFIKRVADLSQVYDLASTLRGVLLTRTIKQIERDTNALLEKYFDSELRVAFTPDDSDGLEVAIAKSGYQATYNQLSKGQRRLLTLAFSFTVMDAAANAAGIHFNLIGLDEPTDGLDVDLKVRAYALFSKLALTHEAVLVIEHSPELQTCFGKKFKVEMHGDASSIEKV